MRPAFGVLALSLVRGFSLPFVRAGVAAALFGVADELHQTTLAGRDPSVGDWVADVVGVALVLAMLHWRRRALRAHGPLLR
ncbi:VanZ family protein [Aromatoleum bremense]|uniref:VanZ-like domain-containing protein n=1 Tax=Aromatoleum bremense TaxID=76115 RepID=A0ABX1P182_9RHOO|nr:VanZ family protein [Aromatoleum bremense]NMG17756.1 hypothetical protein [Aromatoleum bremense]QTQ33569.1 VanZ-like [Aromatoleum bremense]